MNDKTQPQDEQKGYASAVLFKGSVEHLKQELDSHYHLAKSEGVPPIGYTADGQPIPPSPPVNTHPIGYLHFKPDDTSYGVIGSESAYNWHAKIIIGLLIVWLIAMGYMLVNSVI